MKTLEKLYEEIQADSELKKEYVKAIENKTKRCQALLRKLYETLQFGI